MKAKNLFLTFVALTAIALSAFAQTSFTWNGLTSSDWATTTNWTPNGIPGAIDNVSIVAATNDPVLDQTRAINNFSITGGTLDLNTFALTVNGTGATSGGNVNNGTIDFEGTSVTFSETVFGASVIANCNTLLLNGSTFNGTAFLEKTGGGGNNGTGGNTFTSTTTITNSGSGYLLLAGSQPDTFNTTVTFHNTGSSGFHIATHSTGNIFNGNATFNNSSTGDRMSIALSGTAAFNGNIVVNGSAGGGIKFGESTGSVTLASGKTITTSSGFSAGTLLLKGFTQLGTTTQSLTLDLTGSGILTVGPNSSFDGNVNFAGPGLLLNGAVYNGTAFLEKTGGGGNNGTGGNTFTSTTTITNSGSGYLLLAGSQPDTFNTTVTFHNTGSSGFHIATHSTGNIFNGDATFNNSSTGDRMSIAFSGAAVFNENIIINASAGTGIKFGESTGSVTLAATKTITTSTGFSVGDLFLKGFTQLGSTPQSLTLTGTTSIMAIGPNSSFGGDVNFTSPGLLLNGAVYNGTAYLVKTGASGDAGKGGNTFYGLTTITNSGTSSLTLGLNNPDTFNADVTFNNIGSGSNIFVAHNSAGNTFNGNIEVNSTDGTGSSGGGVQFGTGVGTSTLAAAKTITIGGLGFTAGILRLSGFTRLGTTTQSLTLDVTGTGILVAGPNSSFNGDVIFIAPRLYLQGAVYNGTAFLEKTGAGGENGRGGNIFHDITVITNSGEGYLLSAFSIADTFHTDVTFNNTGVAAFPYYGMYIAHKSAGNTFYGNTIFNNTGTGMIVTAFAGTASFNEDIVVSSNIGEGIQFGGRSLFNDGTGTVTLAATKTITIGGGFSSGDLLLKSFTQTGATAQSLALTGTSTSLTIGPNSSFGGNVNFTSPGLFLNGAVYNGTAFLEKTGASGDNGKGGNIFHDITVIANSGEGYLLSAFSIADTFHTDVTFNNTGVAAFPYYGMYIAHKSAGNTFYGNTIFNNTGTGMIVTAFAGTASFNEDIVVSSNIGEGIQFGGRSLFNDGTGTVTLAATKTITIGGGFSSGDLLLKGFTHLGATAQSLALTGTSSLSIGANSSFGGDVDFICPQQLSVNSSIFHGTGTFSGGQLFLSGSIFTGVSTFEKTGTGNDFSDGGNVFNDNTVITNSGTGYIALARVDADTFQTDVTFNNLSSGLRSEIHVATTTTGNIFNGNAIFNNASAETNGHITVAFRGTASFNGNIITNNTSGGGVHFGGSTFFPGDTGRVIISGATPQSLNGNSSPICRYLIIDKPAGDFTVNTGIVVTDSLQFNQGDIVLGNNDLTFGVTSVTVGEGPTKYIQIDNNSGVVKKDYNGALIGVPFTYPVGDQNDYTPFNLTLTSATFSGTPFISVKMLTGVEPHLVCLKDYINRFWVVEQEGLADLKFDVSYTYADGDIVGDENVFKALKWNEDLGLVDVGTVDAGTNTLSAPGIKSFGNFTADRSEETAVVADFTFVESGCANGIIQFTSTDENGTHFWDFGDGNFSSEVNPNHLYLETAPADTFVVTHAITTDCNTDTVIDTVEVRFSQPDVSTIVGNKLVLTSTTPSDLSVCGQSEGYTVSIVNTSANTVYSLFLNPHLSFGIKYTAGTVVGMTEVDIDISHEPLFFLDSLQSGDSVVVTYLASACCAVIDYIDLGNLILNQARVDYNGGFDTETAPVSYNILSPVLTLANPNINPSVFEGQVGDIFTRSITLINSGNAPVSDIFLIDAHNEAISVNSVNTGTLTSTNSTDTITITAADLIAYGFSNGLLMPDSSIIIEEEVEIVCASIPQSPSELTVLWGCIEEGCNQGDPNATTFANVIILPGGGPVIRFTDVFSPGICYGSGINEPHELIIRNTGTSTAYNVQMSLNKINKLSHTGIVLNSFVLTDKDGNSSPIAPDTIIKLDTGLTVCADDTIGDVQFSFPDIAISDTVILTWESVTCCPAQTACNTSPKNNGINFSASFTDLCDPETAKSSGGSTGPAEVAELIQSYEGETDIFEGDTATFIFINERLKVWSGDSTKILQVVYTLDTGLTYLDSSLFMLFSDGSEVIPQTLTITGANDGKTVTQITANFTFPPLPVLGSINYLASEFRIDLIAVCAAPPTSSIGHQVNFIPSTNCSSICAIPLSCREQKVAVHCPGCRRQGIHALGFKIKRTNVGSADNDNNGVADLSGALRFDRIKTNRAMVGDTIEGAFRTDVQITSDYNPFPFPYDLTYGYYSIKLTESQLLKSLGTTLCLYDSQQDTTYVFTIPPEQIRRSGSEFFHDYSIDTLHKYGFVPTTYTKFSNGDEIIFKPRYKVIGNIGLNEIRPVEIVNHTYLGVIPNPSCDPETCLPDSIFGLVNVCGKFLPQCDTNVLYYCTLWGGLFSIMGYDNGASTSSSGTGVTCEQVINTSTSFRVFGGVGTNAFPFEYRNWAHMDTNVVTIPEGYEFERASLNITRTAGTGQSLIEFEDILPDVIIGDTLIFNAGQHFTDNPLFSAQNDGLLYLSDESFSSQLTVVISNTCDKEQDVHFPYESDLTLAIEDVLTADTLIITTDNFDLDGTVIFRDPELSLISNLPTVDGLEDEVCWDVIILNSGVHADKTWLSAISPSGKLNITKVIDINTLAALPFNNDIFQVGSVSGTRRVRICANYTCTQDLDPDNFVVYVGWSCADYPTGLDSLECPAEDSITLTIQPKQAGLQATFTGLDTIDLCSPIPYEILVNSTGVGTMKDLKVSFTLPALSGLFFEAGSAALQFPFPLVGSTPIADPVFVGNNTFEWNIGDFDSYIANNGLKGGGFIPDSSKFKLTFNLLTNCDFTAGDVINFKVSGVSNCGDSIALAFQTDPQILIGFPEFTSTDIDLVVNDFATCGTTTEARVSIINTGNLLIGDNDTVHVELPTGLDFVTSSFTGVHNAPVNGVPLVTSSGSITDFAWHLPAGVVPGDSIVFTFDMDRTDETTCGPFTLEGIVVVTDSVDCSTGGKCEVGTAASRDVITLDVVPGDASFSLPDSICWNHTLSLSSSSESCNTHLWDFGDGTTSTDVNPTHVYVNTPDGFYNIIHTVGPCNPATVVKTIFVYDCCANLVANTSVTNVSCNGAGDGAVQANPQGGKAPYTFDWSTGATTPGISGLVPGLYSVLITDDNQCTVVDTIEITEPAVLTAAVIGTNVNCTGVCDGAANLTLAGGTAPFTFLWSNGATSEDLSGLCGGSFTVAVTDNNGCTVSASVVITEPLAALGASIAGTNVSCNGGSDGTSDLSVTGGTQPLTFLWTPGGETSEDIAGLVAGVHSVGITDANGCTFSAAVTITEPAALIATIAGTDVSCNGGSDGAADLTVAGGTLPYIFDWSNGSASEDLTGLTAGTFSVTVTDANGCEATATIVITEPSAPITLELTGDTVRCSNDGPASISVIVQGGTPVYSYLWSTGETTDVISVLPSVTTTFTVIVTDANGCTDAGSIEVQVFPLPNADFSADSVCLGDAILFESVDTNTNATHFWDFDDGFTNTNASPTHVFAGAEGFYEITHIVTTGASCADTASHTIFVEQCCPLPIIGDTLPISVSGPTTFCDGQSVTLTAVNAVSYLWSTGETTQSIVVTTSGSFSVVVTDARDCQVGSITVIVTLYPSPSVDAGACQTVLFGYGPEECATLSASVTGGTSPYSFLWSTGETTQDIIVCPGSSTTFTVIVTDANGCSGSSGTGDITVEVIDVRCGNKLDKVRVCHYPPGNPSNVQNICISENAVATHLTLHGDSIGICGAPDPCVQAKWGGSAQDDATDYIEYSEDTNDNVDFEDRHSLQNSIEIYPNPNTGEFTLLMLPEALNTKTSVIIYNVLGEVVYKNEDMQNHYLTIDISNHPKGVYFIEVINTDEIFVGKVIYQ